MESWNFCRIIKRAPDGESKTVLLDSNRITHLQFWTEELKLVVFLYYCDISCFVKKKKKKTFRKTVNVTSLRFCNGLKQL